QFELLNALTKPLIDSIIQIDKRVLEEAANKDIRTDSLINRCDSTKPVFLDPRLLNSPLYNYGLFNFDYINYVRSVQQRPKKCGNFLFEHVPWPDWLIGVILLIASLLV